MADGVCVIIATRNGASTIARAIGSALQQPEVVSVVVVDDASSDGTAATAAEADDGTGRLLVTSLTVNRGPSFARNRALELNDAPLVAILDDDDYFLPGRLSRLLAQPDWDMIADNVVFVSEAGRPIPAAPTGRPPMQLGLREFVAGNLSRRGVLRGEYGFLKPVMRRSFLDAWQLRYNQALRLGEDYDLYARMLMRGARFTVLFDAGYVALWRANSLSSRHETGDLAQLLESDRRLITSPGLDQDTLLALHAHQAQVRDRYLLRRFLDDKRAAGLGSAMLKLLREPSAWTSTVASIVVSKLERPVRHVAGDEVRYLLPR